MKEHGCEIEAEGINYTIRTHARESYCPFAAITKRLIRRPSRGGRTGPENSPAPAKEPTPSAVRRRVLKDVSFRAMPWEILAVVGPSGAGKSSLLEILAGKLAPDSAAIYVNGKPVDPAWFRRISGYVTQKDTLFPLLTVEETLMFSAKLRLRQREPDLRSRVKALLNELGLDHVAGSPVGDDRVRGISGGERRRVSIGVDVIHDPKVVILDEPTSGLDSTSALQIIHMLKSMADTRGRTVILSIHQPGFRIVKLFGSILLLANGSVLHHGTVEQLGFQLGLMGLQLPPHVNVVEFAIESIQAIQEAMNMNPQLVVTTTTTTPQFLHKARGGSTTTNCRNVTLQQLFQQSKVMDDVEYSCGEAAKKNRMMISSMDVIIIPRGFANSRLQETAILTHRFSNNIFRTRELFAGRTAQMLVSGLVLGSIFYNLGEDLVGARERVGLFAFVLTFLLSSTIEALPICLQEREILMKETSSGSYRVSSYAVANAVVYLPFLFLLAALFSLPLYWLAGLNPGYTPFARFLLLIWLVLYTANSVVVCFSALVPDFIVGNSVISGVMGSFFLFSGYFITRDEIPKYWVFAHYVSLFKYPFEGFLINEFTGSGKCLGHMFGSCVVRGEDVLKEQGYARDTWWQSVAIMLCFIVAYRLLAYVILEFRCSHRNVTLRGAS